MTRTRNDLSLTATAHHEASHAVVHLTFGHTVTSVSIMKSADGNGVVTIPSPMLADLGDTDLRRRRRRYARQSIIASFAGLIGHRRIDPDAPDSHGASDESMAWELSTDYEVWPPRCETIGDEVHRDYLETLRRKAGRLVTQYWSEVGVLAGLLLKRKKLDTKQIEKFARRYFSE